jgi:hypothetical protein
MFETLCVTVTEVTVEKVATFRSTASHIYKFRGILLLKGEIM